MRDAIKTLYEHWINVHTTTPAEQSAFEAINEAVKGQAEHDPLYTAIVDYSEVIQYEAFKEGVLTALSLLHTLPEQGTCKHEGIRIIRRTVVSFRRRSRKTGRTARNVGWRF